MLENSKQLENKDNFFNIIKARHTVREFLDQPIDDVVIDEIIGDGCQAPSACNHQMWHFVVVRDVEKKKLIQKISGSNTHFIHSPVLIVLCFHRGWNHNKFAVIQSLAANVDHMILSATARGLSTVWNAGIGSGDKIGKLLGVPFQFEIVGVLCLGKPGLHANIEKPPRRPISSIRSWEKFQRPDEEIYPLKRINNYKYEYGKDGQHRYSVFSPQEWGWNKIKNFRSYAVFAKSPVAGTYISRRFNSEMDAEIEEIPPLSVGSKLLEVMPFGGAYSAKILKKVGENVDFHIADLSQNNINFVLERLTNEGYLDNLVKTSIIKNGLFEYPDDFFDVIFVPQIVEAVPSVSAFLKELHRIVKPNGSIIISSRNVLSWFGAYYFRFVRRGQVPNFGPYFPINPFFLRKKISGLFSIKKEFGLSFLPNSIGQKVSGPLKYFSKLYVIIFGKNN